MPPVLPVLRSCLPALLVLVGACSGARAPGGPLVVSAASDLTPAFQELGALFERSTGTAVTFNFGSTGQLAQQIEQGAPVDVFAAANVQFVDELERKGRIVPGTKRLYAQGRITLWRRSDSSLQIETLVDLERPEVRRVAIANPEHAPYGVAAREALQSVGLWDRLQPKLVLGENVSQTLQYAETGNVDVAIVALSLSTQSSGRWTLIPADLHKPLTQALAVVSGTQREARAREFAEFVVAQEGRTVMRKYGFILPGEDAPR